MDLETYHHRPGNHRTNAHRRPRGPKKRYRYRHEHTSQKIRKKPSTKSMMKKMGSDTKERKLSTKTNKPIDNATDRAEQEKGCEHNQDKKKMQPAAG